MKAVNIDPIKFEIMEQARQNLLSYKSGHYGLSHGEATTTFRRPTLLQPGYGQMLMVLYIKRGPMRTGELVKAIGKPKGHHVTTIQRLKLGGLIVRTTEGWKITPFGKVFVESVLLK